jgi:Flp pilus assembly protein TadG
METVKASSEMSRREHGATLIMVALSLVVLLGMSALAIDLAAFYVARNEAQRAADAAALGGAKVFVETSCVSLGTCTTSTVQDQAKQRAKTVGAQNTVFGQAADIRDSDLSFATDANAAQDPRITVTVQRIAARGNAVPTFFAKILGKNTVDIGAIATAEAYNPSGSANGPTICASCVKPFVLANCDSSHPAPANPNCPGQGYFIDPSTGAIEHSRTYPVGVVGQEWVVHTGGGQQGSPSQYQVVDVGCGSGNQVPCITGCTTSLYACGSTTTTVQGARVGQIRSVNTLIHASGDGPANTGQDTITINPDGSWTVKGGTNNPNPALVGKTIINSDSLVTLPIYDGHTLNPGKQTVTIIGYMQVFIEYLNPQIGSGDIPITVRILNVTGCGNRTGTCGDSSSTVQGGGGSLIPIRLVRNPGS